MLVFEWCNNCFEFIVPTILRRESEMSRSSKILLHMYIPQFRIINYMILYDSMHRNSMKFSGMLWNRMLMVFLRSLSVFVLKNGIN